MPKFGLIGDPISTSKSPILFRAAYNGKYDYDLIEGSDFEASYSKFLEDYKSINVTAPFKENAFRKADIISGPVSKIGASNLLKKTENGVEAHNSDFTGIILCVAEAYFPGIINEFYATFGPKAYIKIHQFFRQSISRLFPKTPQALIVGCGGAGRAAAVAAAELGFETALMNRTPEKAQKIADELPEHNFIVDPITDFGPALRECELVIYTLPMAIPAIGLLTEEDFTGEDRYSSGRPSKVILEANYKTPSFSGEVLERLNSSGAQYIPGKRWLIGQAITGYGIMTDEQPDIAAIASSL